MPEPRPITFQPAGLTQRRQLQEIHAALVKANLMPGPAAGGGLSGTVPTPDTFYGTVVYINTETSQSAPGGPITTVVSVLLGGEFGSNPRDNDVMRIDFPPNDPKFLAELQRVQNHPHLQVGVAFTPEGGTAWEPRVTGVAVRTKD